jgi:NusA-like KH domain protein
MSNVIDMQLMRYINLFEKISRVTTNKCFVYNNAIIFAVHPSLVSKAIGRDAENAKKLSEILRKKIKIIAFEDDICKLAKSIIEPYEFVKCETAGNQVIITANKQNKAGIIGRNRQREKELEDILKKFFGISGVRIL